MFLRKKLRKASGGWLAVVIRGMRCDEGPSDSVFGKWFTTVPTLVEQNQLFAEIV